jgi:hypothetical protein
MHGLVVGSLFSMKGANIIKGPSPDKYKGPHYVHYWFIMDLSVHLALLPLFFFKEKMVLDAAGSYCHLPMVLS